MTISIGNDHAGPDYKFEIVKHRAKQFLKKPSKEFFELKTLTEQDIRKKFQKNNLIMLKAKPLNKKEDVAGAKMLKAFRFIEQNLVSYGFKVVESDMLWDSRPNSLFYYALENDKLSKTIEISGPPLKIKHHLAFFRKKHKKTVIKKNRIFAVEKRKFTNAKDLMKNLIKISNVKNNLKNIELI